MSVVQEVKKTFKDLTVYKKAFVLAMKIFELSKEFPKEERFSLTDQIRRSSRSVCICVSEAYRKRLYPAHFVSKSTDADIENSETQSWLDFAHACNYMNENDYVDLIDKSEEVGRLLHHMIENPQKYLTTSEKLKSK